MKVVYLSNYFNHHQKPLSDAMYSLLGGDYFFIETADIPEFRKKLGYQKLTAPYVMHYSQGNSGLIQRIINDADAVIYGEAPLRLVKERYNTGKLTFRDDESRFKSINRYLKWPIYTYNSFWINKGFLLCSSAYAPIDYKLSGMKQKKCFRWGYYTEVKRHDLDSLMNNKKNETSGVSILWVGRMIRLKHPEAVCYVASHLREKGLKFKINIVGTGPLEGLLKRMIEREKLEEYVSFLGAMAPEDVRFYMEKAEVFLFTSDRREGWGAVLNEAMNSGCAVIADGNIGSVPFLLEDGVNGIVYKSENWSDLSEKVVRLSQNPDEREKLGRMAYKTMVDLWNAENAARNFIILCDSLLKGNVTRIKNGPCSQAPLLLRKYRGVVNSL